MKSVLKQTNASPFSVFNIVTWQHALEFTIKPFVCNVFDVVSGEFIHVISV